MHSATFCATFVNHVSTPQFVMCSIAEAEGDSTPDQHYYLHKGLAILGTRLHVGFLVISEVLSWTHN